MQIIDQLILNYQKLSYQKWKILGKRLGPLLKTGLPLVKNVINPLAKSTLVPLELIAAASAADAGIGCDQNTNNIKWCNRRHCENN